MSQIINFAMEAATGEVSGISGGTGGDVSPDGTGIIDIIGSSTIDTTGYPLSNSIGLSVGGGTDGQVLIASTTADPAWSTLRAGSGISITEASGSITINSASGVLAINNQTGYLYTPVLSDASGYITMNSATNCSFSIPLNSNVAFPIGTVIYIQRLGAGWVEITSQPGVTLLSSEYSDLIRRKYAIREVIKIDTNTWSITG